MKTVGKQGVSIKDELINGIFDELTLIWYEKQLMSCVGLAVGDDHEQSAQLYQCISCDLAHIWNSSASHTWNVESQQIKRSALLNNWTKEHNWARMKNEPSEIRWEKDLQCLRPQIVTLPTRMTGNGLLRSRVVLLLFFNRFNKLEKTHLCTSWNMCSLESLWLLIVYSTLRPIWNTLTRTPSLLWSSSYRHRRDKLRDQYTSISNRP